MESHLNLKSVVLTSDDPERVAHFYREVVGLDITPERHRGAERHHAGQVGELHFAVHARQGFWLPGDSAATIVSFTDDVARAQARMAAHGVPVVARNQIGPMPFIAVRDPDGRYVCFGAPWPGAAR